MVQLLFIDLMQGFAEIPSQIYAQIKMPCLSGKLQMIPKYICLGQFGFKEDASAIIPLMKDESWPVRIAAAEALGKLGEPAAVSSLSEALEDEDEDLAMAAMISLGKIHCHMV